ncbi:MAG: cyclase family protein [Chitinophagaceae bacterium]
MKSTIFLFLLFITSCQQTSKKITLPELLATGKWIDLSYDFSEETIYWPNNPTGFKLDTQFNGMTPAGFYYSSNAFFTPEHGGTHLDAPVHFARGKWSVDQIPLEQLTGVAVIIDVSEKTKDKPDYQVSVADITEWENQNGEIPDNAIVLFRTGWGKFYHDPSKYLGTAEKGEAAIADLHFPSILPDLATWLLKNRKIKAVGVDTPSVDYGQSKDFKTHQLLYAENILGFENVANLDKLPVKGAYIFALPMKIKDGSGGPLRIIAWIEE